MPIYTPTDNFRKRVAWIESGGRPDAVNPRSSAKGLFQFTKGTAKQYGLLDPLDPAAATEAFDSLTADNYASLKQTLGREPTEGELYLAHQQGAGGAAKILKDPNAKAVDVLGKKQVLLNGGNEDMTAGDFAKLWTEKYDSTSEKYPTVPAVQDLIGGGGEQTAMNDPIMGALMSGVEQAQNQPADPLGMFAQADTGIQNDADLDLFAGQPPAEAEMDLLGGQQPAQPIEGLRNRADVRAPAKTGNFRTFVDQFNQGTLAGWADEVTDPLGALLAAALSGKLGGNFDINNPDDLALAEELAGARAGTQANLKAQQKESPWLSGGAQVAGGLTGAIGASKILPNAASTKIGQLAKQYPALAAMLTGGSSAGVYSAGASENEGLDRLDRLGIDVPIGMAGGYAGYKLAQGGNKLANYLGERGGAPWDAVKGKAKDFGRAIGILDDVPPAQAAQAAGGAANPPNLSAKALVGMLDEDDAARLTQGKVLPMTAGERTQNVKTQRMEEIAEKAGSEAFTKARNIQQEAAYKPFTNVLGKDQLVDAISLDGRVQDEMGVAADIVRQQYDDLGKQVTEAYKVAREGAEGVGISAQAIHDDFLGKVDEIYSVENLRKGDLPKLDDNMQELRDILKPAEGETGSITALKLDKLEAWKKRLNRTIGNTTEAADARVVKMVGKQYDEFLANLADDAIVNGDEAAIKAFQNARGLASKKFQFYESDKAIQKILDNRDLSGSQLVNTLLGGGKLAGSKGEDGRLIETMFTLAGDKAPEMQSAMKRGVMANMLKESLSGVKNPANQDRHLLNFERMQKSLGSFMKQKEAFTAVFDTPDEQKFLKQLYDDLDTISSKQKGAVNNSSTGSYMADFIEGLGKVINNPIFRNTPVLGTVTTPLQNGIQSQAAAIVTGKAESGLDDFVQFMAGQIGNIDAPAAYYGGYAGGLSVDPIGNIIDKELNDGN